MALYPDTSCFYRAEVIATRAVDRVGLFFSDTLYLADLGF
jgi:hypothetical protein